MSMTDGRVGAIAAAWQQQSLGYQEDRVQGVLRKGAIILSSTSNRRAMRRRSLRPFSKRDTKTGQLAASSLGGRSDGSD